MVFCDRTFHAQWLYGLWRALLGVRAFLATVACEVITRKLDSSIGESGPHAFAVREAAFAGAAKRAAQPHVHRIPLPTSVTIAIRPSDEGGIRADNHIFLKNGR